MTNAAKIITAAGTGLISGIVAGIILMHAGILINLGPWIPILLFVGVFGIGAHALWRGGLK